MSGRENMLAGGIRKKGRPGRLPGRYLFLLLVLLLYGLVALADPPLVGQALHGFWRMFLKVIPILCFVFVLLTLFNHWLQPEMIERMLGNGSGVKGWLLAVVGGILLMGPPYVLYPLLARLRELGARDALVIVFLYNRNVKIPFLPAMIYYLGLQYSIVLSIYIILFSVLNGLCIEWLLKKGGGTSLDAR